jgi:hypothetical protein
MITIDLPVFCRAVVSQKQILYKQLYPPSREQSFLWGNNVRNQGQWQLRRRFKLTAFSSVGLALLHEEKKNSCLGTDLN